jgi:hypothetical protein
VISTTGLVNYPTPFGVVVVPGNHDFAVEDSGRRNLISNATLLVNEGVEVLRLRIRGSPMTPLYGGAFGRSSEQDRVKIYSRIPTGTDILTTHGPPHEILELPRYPFTNSGFFAMGKVYAAQSIFRAKTEHN